VLLQIILYFFEAKQPFIRFFALSIFVLDIEAVHLTFKGLLWLFFLFPVLLD
jgi:hypothetical protein